METGSPARGRSRISGNPNAVGGIFPENIIIREFLISSCKSGPISSLQTGHCFSLGEGTRIVHLLSGFPDQSEIEKEISPIYRTLSIKKKNVVPYGFQHQRPAILFCTFYITIDCIAYYPIVSSLRFSPAVALGSLPLSKIYICMYIYFSRLPHFRLRPYTVVVLSSLKLEFCQAPGGPSRAGSSAMSNCLGGMTPNL